MDERDCTILWMRGEFAAANSITDLLLRHLQSVGDPGEYDQVLAAVNEHRRHWHGILHVVEQCPSVYHVDCALQQALSRRRAHPPHHPLQDTGLAPLPRPLPLQDRVPVPPSPSPLWHPALPRPRPLQDRVPDPSRPGGIVACDSYGHARRQGNGLEDGEKLFDAKSLHLDSLITMSRPGSEEYPMPMEYITNEIVDGKLVNTVEGLRVYGGFVHMTVIDEILYFANETKKKFRRGGFTGRTVILGRRPLRFHGSLTIQLGLPIVDGPQRETRVEAVPGLLQNLFDRFFQQGIVPSKPDYCVIDFFDEGEFSRPQQPPPWYGRPFCTLCLTECDMVFGQVILGERGNTRGPLKLSLSTGSLLVLQGRSADVAQRCVPASCKQRMLLTFGKSLPRELPAPTAT